MPLKMHGRATPRPAGMWSCATQPPGNREKNLQQCQRNRHFFGSLKGSFSTNYSKKNSKKIKKCYSYYHDVRDKSTNYRDDRVWTTIKETMLHPSQSSWCSFLTLIPSNRTESHWITSERWSNHHFAFKPYINLRRSHKYSEIKGLLHAFTS